ncbi:hypothetical protein BJ546DRAFT_444247 [Cryomyces antarcticus]
MSNAIVGGVYQKIIQEVIAQSQNDFEESGVDQGTLSQLQDVRIFPICLPTGRMFVHIDVDDETFSLRFSILRSSSCRSACRGSKRGHTSVSWSVLYIDFRKRRPAEGELCSAGKSGVLRGRRFLGPACFWAFLYTCSAISFPAVNRRLSCSGLLPSRDALP